jgi:hypothetical protein
MENFRKYMKNDNERNPTTLSNASIREITEILGEEIKCSLLFLEEKGVSLEELESSRINVINYVHDTVDKMNCEEEYKTRIITTIYEKLLYAVFSLVADKLW